MDALLDLDFDAGPFRAGVSDQCERGCGFVGHISIARPGGNGVFMFEEGGSDVFFQTGFAHQDEALAWARKRLREIAAEIVTALGEEA